MKRMTLCILVGLGLVLSVAAQDMELPVLFNRLFEIEGEMRSADDARSTITLTLDPLRKEIDRKQKEFQALEPQMVKLSGNRDEVIRQIEERGGVATHTMTLKTFELEVRP